TEEESPGGSIRYKEEHPAFGQVSFSRRHGNVGKLYGSNLDNNEMYVTLTIKRSCLYHDLSRDWFFSGAGAGVEVDLSAAQ
ncbi:hypothetical protein MEO41_29285, partial [Dolichospermum sp. ST_sed4]|nr:hypothetical protein [Dolichospermum sp. ST_sed4]